MRSLRLTSLPLSAALILTPAVAAQTLDDFEDLLHEEVVTERVLDGVTVTISTANDSQMTARTYGDPAPIAFQGPAGMANTALNPLNVSGDRFISSNDGNAGFDDSQPIVFTFSCPVRSFRVTSLDLLENTIGPGSFVTLEALDVNGNVIVAATRTGPQGPSGLDLDWSISSMTSNIASARLVGTVGNNNDGFGLDDMGIQTGPPPGTALLANPSSISVATGGTQHLCITAGPAQAGNLYLVLGSSSGTAPPFPVGPALVPLVPDNYSLFVLAGTNGPIYENTLGFLDADGTANAAIHVPMGLSPTLAGTHLDHAYLVFSPLGVPQGASNPAPLVLVP